MTREEAIEILKNPNETYQETDGIVGYTFNPNRRNYKAFQLAIKALEQGPILDKIRAEIKALKPEPTAYDVVDGNPIKDAVWETLADVLKIIDKYKAEMESEE